MDSLPIIALYALVTALNATTIPPTPSQPRRLPRRECPKLQHNPNNKENRNDRQYRSQMTAIFCSDAKNC
ncbi:hypothetical protein BJX99DRAFT_242144 [Aspergillus californicus]